MHVLLIKSIHLPNRAITGVSRIKWAKTPRQFTARQLKSAPNTSEPKQPLLYKDVQLGRVSPVPVYKLTQYFLSGIPKEIWKNERRVALAPATVATFTKKGIRVLVEENAGSEAKFSNTEYEASGATVVNRDKLFTQSNIILKVRPPVLDTEVKLFQNNSTLIGMLFPAQNKELIDQLAKKNMNVFAMDCIPRISRAQTYDVLSSMANIAGYVCSMILFRISTGVFFLVDTRL